MDNKEHQTGHKCEDSELLKNLKDYKIDPNSHIQRKIDYYYSPYGAIKQKQKHMHFDETHDE